MVIETGLTELHLARYGDLAYLLLTIATKVCLAVSKIYISITLANV